MTRSATWSMRLLDALDPAGIERRGHDATEAGVPGIVGGDHAGEVLDHLRGQVEDAHRTLARAVDLGVPADLGDVGMAGDRPVPGTPGAGPGRRSRSSRARRRRPAGARRRSSRTHLPARSMGAPRTPGRRGRCRRPRGARSRVSPGPPYRGAPRRTTVPGLRAVPVEGRGHRPARGVPGHRRPVRPPPGGQASRTDAQSTASVGRPALRSASRASSRSTSQGVGARGERGGDPVAEPPGQRRTGSAGGDRHGHSTLAVDGRQLDGRPVRHGRRRSPARRPTRRRPPPRHRRPAPRWR